MQNKVETIWIDLNEELYYFIFAKVKDENLAHDILQDVFLKIQLNLDQLKQTSKLTSWVYQITRNTIVDHYRNQKKVLRLSKNNNLAENDVDDFEYAKLTNCINDKIKGLTKEYQEAIVLTYLKMLSQKQYAERIQLPYSSAKSRVQKARNILKKNILDCPNVESDTTGTVIDFHKKIN